MLDAIFSSPYFVWPVSILLASFIFSLAIFIHEFGHFLAARLLGLKADVFSIGFGPALWKRTIGQTEWRISAIPFGGYVSLPQLDPDGMKNLQGEHGDPLPPATPWKRIIVAIAGPMGNVMLALFCAICIAVCAPVEAIGGSTTIGYVKRDSSAWNAGLRRGDTLLSVNETPVATWMAFQTECFLSGTTNDVVRITYERDAQQYTTEAVLDTQVNPSEAIYVVGGVSPGPVMLGISDIAPNSPAEQAGLQKFDIILAINGTPFEQFEQLTDAPLTRDGAPITLRVRRAQEEFDVTLTPQLLSPEEEQPRLGVGLALLGKPQYPWMSERGVLAQIKSDVSSIVRVLRALTAPKVEGERGRAAKGLGGPLMIFAVLAQVVQMGLWASLGFLRLICINLAFINLLPLPVLDGGHVLFASCAVVLRKELNPKVVGYITTAFSFLLIAMMIWFLFADLRRFIINLFF